jgi:hypothetical protein
LRFYTTVECETWLSERHRQKPDFPAGYTFNAFTTQPNSAGFSSPGLASSPR